jgi:hypothetical protein
VQALFIEGKGNLAEMSELEMTTWCENNLMEEPPLNISALNQRDYIDLRFFSEYIPQLGMDVSVEFVHQTPGDK